MARENLRIVNPNTVRVDGYFYHISNGEILEQRTDDGSIAFSYPLDTPINNEVVSIEFDGKNYFTLENPSGNFNIIMRKWQIEEFSLRLKRTYQFTESATQKYDSNAFAVEHFHFNLDNAASSGTNILDLGDDKNLRLDVGDRIFVGPSSAVGFEGLTETRTILATSGSNNEFVILSSNLSNSYELNDPASVSTRVWFFNQYRPNDPDSNGSGQLFSFDHNAASITLVAQEASNEYKDVLSATYLTDLPGTVNERDYLVFMKGTSLLFIETDDFNPNFKVTVKSATQNNQRPDNSVIDVYEITHENNTIFRFQLEATFQIGSTEVLEVWGTTGDPEYNYQLSELSPRPFSISLTATPAIISADGVSTSTIDALVADQFGNPLAGRTVNFSEDDVTGSPAGQVAPTSDITNSQGMATTTYTAGTVNNLVTITASVN